MSSSSLNNILCDFKGLSLENSQGDNSLKSSEKCQEITQEITQESTQGDSQETTQLCSQEDSQRDSSEKNQGDSQENTPVNIKSNWIDCGIFWLNLSKQRDPEWLTARIGRVTGSIVDKAANGARYGTKVITQDEVADELSGITKKEFSSEEKERMDYGTDHEDDARKWYEQTFNVTVEEIGLAVPKFNSHLGASIDGAVFTKIDIENKKKSWETPGMIEIKCPKKMYTPLKEYNLKVAHGWKPPKGYHQHIWSSHYAQMQMGMITLGKEWCDYIVYCIPEQNIFVERVFLDLAYWNMDLYPKITRFIDTRLKPRLDRKGIKIVMPC